MIRNWVMHLSMIKAMQFLLKSLIIPNFTKVELMVDFFIAIGPMGIPTGN